MHTTVVTCSEGALGVDFAAVVFTVLRVPVKFLSSVTAVGKVVWFNPGDRVLVPPGSWVVLLCVKTSKTFMVKGRRSYKLW